MAGWALLGLYYVEERREDAGRLGLSLHDQEPDPRDRVQLLLELVRQAAKPIVAFTVVRTLEPVVREHPDDLQASLGLTLAYLRDDRADDGLPIFQRLVDQRPDDPIAWRSLLDGLEQAIRPEELARTLEKLPSNLADDPRFALYRRVVAQNRGDWPTAADQYFRARAFDPTDSHVLYRLVRALRLAKRAEEADRFNLESRAMNAAINEILLPCNRANQAPDLGAVPDLERCRSLADLRELMGHRAEALAWHRLILGKVPDDPTSRAAVSRLEDAKAVTLAEVLDAVH